MAAIFREYKSICLKENTSFRQLLNCQKCQITDNKDFFFANTVDSVVNVCHKYIP